MILDADWDGSPGAEKIREHISGNLRVQWEESVVVVIEPELESWIWVTSEVRQVGLRETDEGPALGEQPALESQ